MESSSDIKKIKHMKKIPKVAVILINWNGLRDTLECIKSLINIDYRNYKIILIDNGSGGNEAQIIKKTYPNIHLIKNSRNTGFCKANNQGIKYAIKNNFTYILLFMRFNSLFKNHSA